MLAACDRGLALLDLHLRTLGATELRTLATANGAAAGGYGAASMRCARMTPGCCWNGASAGAARCSG